MPSFLHRFPNKICWQIMWKLHANNMEFTPILHFKHTLKPFLLICFFSLLFQVISLGLPSHGCHWTESCQSKWIGGCGAGDVIIGYSNNCNGLCSEPDTSPCFPFYTHFHCCKPEFPKVTDICAKCKNKLDYGDEYICCTDCSNPYIVDGNTKLGYCITGAELAVQLKPREHFHWVAGPWMQCSSPCDGGVQYRDVECFGQIEDMSIRHYAVGDSRCSDEEMPARQEPCNLTSCGGLSNRDSQASDRGMSAWMVTLLTIIGVAVICGLGLAGYTLYQRRNSSQQGFVYIMLEG